MNPLRLSVVGLAAVFACLAVSGSGGATRAETRWVITDLGTIGGKASRAVAINERGQVVGYGGAANRKEHAFIWQDGEMTDLGTLPASEWSRAVAINERGQVIGQSGTSRKYAFVWDDGTMTDLGARADLSSCAYAINESGQIVGRIGSEFGGHAFMWQDGKMTRLGELPGGHKSSAVAVNERGQIVGWSGTATGYVHAYRWQKGKLRDLGTLPGELDSRGVAVNETGQIVGISSMPYVHAILWQGKKIVDLDRIARVSSVIDINDRGQILLVDGLWERGRLTKFDFLGAAINGRGQIVGRTSGTPDMHAIAWEDGKTTDLGTLGGQAEAVAINDRGQIVGRSEVRAGEWHAVLWTLKSDG